MADKQVVFTININGNASEKARQISGSVSALDKSAGRLTTTFKKIGKGMLYLQAAMAVLNKVSDAVKGITRAYNAQIEAETKLTQVMHNTMGAGAAQVDTIKTLTAAQQRLGVVGDEVQLAGAQELATYLKKTESLKTLIPVMNDMLAQQYGLNATQEQAAQIAAMLGKVMDGQVGALSRYGYRFDKAQEKILKFGTEEQRVATLAEVVGSAVGGVNRRMALTNAGKAKQLANSWGDLKEQVGQLGQIASQKVLPVASKLLGIVSKWIAVSPVTEIAREKAELNALVDALIDSTGKEDERKRIIDELQAKYPDFLKNIDLETASNAQLREELKKVNAEYDKRMRKAAYARRREAIENEYADVMDDIVYYETSISAKKQREELFARTKSGLLPQAERYYNRPAGSMALNFFVGKLMYKDAKGVWHVENNVPEGLQAQVDTALEEYKALSEFSSGDFDGEDEKKLAKAQQALKGYRNQIKILDQQMDAEFGPEQESTGPEQESTGTGTVTPAAPAAETKATVRRGVEAATTGGTRNTTVNITIGQMKGVETLNVDSLEQGVADLEQRLAEAMSRVLGMAEMSVA